MKWTTNYDPKIKELELRYNPVIVRVNKFEVRGASGSYKLEFEVRSASKSYSCRTEVAPLQYTGRERIKKLLNKKLRP